jgi:hypothetical protein
MVDVLYFASMLDALETSAPGAPWLDKKKKIADIADTRKKPLKRKSRTIYLPHPYHTKSINHTHIPPLMN